MAHGQKPDFLFRRKRRVHLNRRGRQFSRLLAGELCASAVVMLDTPSSEVVKRVLATNSIRHFPLHFHSRASPCAITFQLVKVKGKAIPLQAWTGPEGSRRLRLPDFKTVGTWRWEGCQPYTPADFTPRKYSWYSFLLEAESTPGP